ncbi:hypothetical protein THRCLA_21760 [Thraustotheca clavata]|uniref:Uncharacterized protein n=1 Tax=Thraustotheca clavata TaxID=74557 RepID=A0A1V9ZPZ1_9STRA|nr:hypothetical protein THRCLA_21760 [Thraustotheca clavata]
MMSVSSDRLMVYEDGIFSRSTTSCVLPSMEQDDILLTFCNFVLAAGEIKRKRKEAEVTPVKRRKSHKVTFTTTTTYEFNLAYNGSAVPLERGPPIGLAWTHVSKKIAPIVMDDSKQTNNVNKLAPHERIILLQRLKHSHEEIASFTQEASEVRESRRETKVEWLRERRQKSS